MGMSVIFEVVILDLVSVFVGQLLLGLPNGVVVQLRNDMVA